MMLKNTLIPEVSLQALLISKYPQDKLKHGFSVKGIVLRLIGHMKESVSSNFFSDLSQSQYEPGRIGRGKLQWSLRAPTRRGARSAAPHEVATSVIVALPEQLRLSTPHTRSLKFNPHLGLNLQNDSSCCPSRCRVSLKRLSKLSHLTRLDFQPRRHLIPAETD